MADIQRINLYNSKINIIFVLENSTTLQRNFNIIASFEESLKFWTLLVKYKNLLFINQFNF